MVEVSEPEAFNPQEKIVLERAAIADELAEKVCRECSKGKMGVRYDDIYPVIFGILFRKLL